MKSRRSARRRALDALYAAEIRDLLPLVALERAKAEEWDRGADPSADEYAATLVAGVQLNLAEIDLLITTYADRWALERMPIIDRNLLRIAIFEIRWQEDVPTAVAINEAVELAKELSTEDSGRFVNGLLGHVAEIGDGG